MFHSISPDQISHKATPQRRFNLRLTIASRHVQLAAVAVLTPVLVGAQAAPHRKASKAHAEHPLTVAPQAERAAPPAPDWPINAQPKPASISWNRQELIIDASNSSLQQILTDIASATGASVDGLTKDERIFGTFGPAPARDVLVKLLQGSGYNVLMVGDQGPGLPRQVILTPRDTSNATKTIARSTTEENDEDFAPPEVQYDTPPQPQQQPQLLPQQPLRPGFNPGAIPQQPGQQPAQQPQGQQPNPQ